MPYFFSFIFFIIAFVAWELTRRLYNPITLFSFFWALIVFGASLSLFNFFRASMRTYIVIFVGVLSYAIAAMLMLWFNRENIDPIGNKINLRHGEERDKNINYHIIYIMLSISFIYSIVKLIRIIPLLQNGADYYQIRTWYWEIGSPVTPTPIDYYLDLYLNKGIQYATLSAACINLFKGRNDHRKFIMIIFTLINIALSILISGGRKEMYILLICLAISIMMFYTGLQSNKWLKRILFIVCVVVVSGMLFVTFIRPMRGSLWKEIYKYFCGCVPYFDLLLGRIDLHPEFTFGANFLNGLLAPFLYFLAMINALEVPAAFKVNGRYTNGFMAVSSDNTLMNEFGTLFFNFFLDGGWVGVVIFSALYGLLCVYVFNKYLKSKSPFWAAAYLLVCVGIFLSMVRWPYFSAEFVLAFFYLKLIYIKKFSILKFRK